MNPTIVALPLPTDVIVLEAKTDVWVIEEMEGWRTEAVTNEATGVTALEAVDVAPVPDTFVAETENVYAVPLVSPVATIEVPEVVAKNTAGLEAML